MAVEKQLEFRGIGLEHLIAYALEINGKQMTKELPIHFIGKQWEITIIKEEEVKITSTFAVNAIHIVFKAEKETILEDLLQTFRKKAMRVGG